jgi:glycosyltransferase involved in cell wall biosynthesis
MNRLESLIFMSAITHNNKTAGGLGLRSHGKRNGASRAVVTATTVAIVTPAYNAARFLSETVASIQAQTYTAWELIIVDDGSSDNTAQLATDLACKDPRIQVHRQPRAGVSSARNFGMSLAKSPYVAFLDADDVWTPRALELLITTLESNPQFPAVYGLSGYVDDAGQALSGGKLETWIRGRLRIEGRYRREVPVDEPTTFDMLAVRNYIAIGAIVVRREVVEKLGGFHAELSGMEDWHLWLRLSRVAPIGFVNEMVLNYRRHDRNVTLNAKKMTEQQFRAAADLYETLNLTDSERKLFLRSQPIACHLYWTCDHIKHGRLRSAAFHLGIATRNLLDYHIAPKLLRRSQV